MPLPMAHMQREEGEMGSTAPLIDRTILLLEDDPIVALKIEEALADAGAKTVVARTLHEGMHLVEQLKFSAAILDFKLHDGDSLALCECLEERAIPYIIYSGFTELQLHFDSNNFVSKPATVGTLIAKVCGLFSIVHPHR
jgi:DNA-binding response OmpR family regulator